MKKHSLLKKPIITEKSMRHVSAGCYMFEVHCQATKIEVAEAVKKNFGVEVRAVKTLSRPGKPKRVLRSRRVVHRSDRKFALVFLSQGQKIAGFEKLLNLETEQPS